MTDLPQIIRVECARQCESCLYTSTTFFLWLRSMRRWRRFFIIAPIVLGGIASWSILQGLSSPWAVWGTALSALAAGLFPAVFKALDLDSSINEVARQAGQYKNLQDRFRQLADRAGITSHERLEKCFSDLMENMEAIRLNSTTPPERFFKAAQKKIKEGDYEFDQDSALRNSAKSR